MQQLRAPRARPVPARAVRARLTRVAAACVLLAGGAALTGCAKKASAATAIELGTAYVQLPDTTGGDTDAYLVIRNNGPADRLTSARTSVGGRVSFRAPVRPGDTTMKTVPDIQIPANSLLRFSPDSSHLLISGAGRMQGGKLIMLTLVFARGGSMSVEATVTNPESGGSSYFIN